MATLKCTVCLSHEWSLVAWLMGLGLLSSLCHAVAGAQEGGLLSHNSWGAFWCFLPIPCCSPEQMCWVFWTNSYFHLFKCSQVCNAPASPTNCAGTLPCPPRRCDMLWAASPLLPGRRFISKRHIHRKSILRVLPWLCVTCIGDEGETSTLQTYPRVVLIRHREAVGEGRKQSMSSSVASCENKL